MISNGNSFGLGNGNSMDLGSTEARDGTRPPLAAVFTPADPLWRI